MILVGAAYLVLRLLEIGQHVVIAPADIAALPPAVVVLMLATHIEQAVDRARPAQHLAARLKHLPAAKAGFRFGLVHPVDGLFLEQFAVAERDVNPDVGVLRPCLQQQHRMPAIGAQPVREHAAGGAGADDDVIELAHLVWRTMTRHVSPHLFLSDIADSILTGQASAKSPKRRPAAAHGRHAMRDLSPSPRGCLARS